MILRLTDDIHLLACFYWAQPNISFCLQTWSNELWIEKSNNI